MFKFCPDCGQATRAEIHEERARATCTGCRRVWYENAKPCATAIIEDDRGRVLLARRATPPGLGLWNLPGGFLEADEAPEAGVVREALEELRLAIEPTALLGAYLEDAGAHFSLSLAYRARIVGGAFAPTHETSEVAWFAPHELPPAAQMAYGNHVRSLADWARLTSTQVLVK